MCYIIKSENEDYLAGKETNTFHITRDGNLATRFITKTKADNVLMNLPKNYRNKGLRVIKKKKKKKEKRPAIKNNNRDNVFSIEEINSKQSMIVRKDKLKDKLSQLDKELTDIDHFIEFNTFSASEGYMIVKMRKDILAERRKIKNEMTNVERVQKYQPRVLKKLFLAKQNNQLIYYK